MSTSTAEKNTVLMMYKFNRGRIRYCLYSFNVNHPVVHDFSCTERKTSISTLLELEASYYPVGMGFVFMENLNKLYMIGGQFKVNDSIYCSKKVYSVDLRSPFSELSVQEAPSMLCGKSNPIVIDAYGMIYVLMTSCDISMDPNTRNLGAAPFHDPQEMTLVGKSPHFKDPLFIFEVFDPQSETWTNLPAPDSLDYNTETEIAGHAVVNDMILIYCHWFLKITAFHVKRKVWFSFAYEHHISKSLSDIDTLLMMHLLNDGFGGRGIIVDGNTLFTLTGNKYEMGAYHIPTRSYEKSCIFGGVHGIEFPVTHTIDSTGGYNVRGENLVYLGHGRMCCVLCDYHNSVHPEKPGDVFVKMFRVYGDSCSCGSGFCGVNVVDSYALQGINTNVGTILYCCAVQNKMVKQERSSLVSPMIKKSRWERDNYFIAASVFIAGVGIIAAAYRFASLKRSS